MKRLSVGPWGFLATVWFLAMLLRIGLNATLNASNFSFVALLPVLLLDVLLLLPACMIYTWKRHKAIAILIGFLIAVVIGFLWTLTNPNAPDLPPVRYLISLLVLPLMPFMAFGIALAVTELKPDSKKE